MAPGRWYDMALLNLRAERDVQLIGDWLDDLNIVWWRFLTPAQRAERAPDLEALLRARLDAAAEPGLKSTWFAALRNVATTPATIAWLRALWQREAAIAGLPLVEADETTLAYALQSQRRGRTAPARYAARADHEPGPQGALRVVRGAASADAGERERWFRALEDPAARRQESGFCRGLGC